MKATLAPIFFKRDRTAKFSNQLQHIKNELSEYVRLLEPIALGEPIDEQADAVVFPEILGEAYEHSDVFKSLGKPILILTSEFMTISMWDWEIMDFLRGKGVQVLAPYNKQQSEIICRSLALKRKMRQTTFSYSKTIPEKVFNLKSSNASIGGAKNVQNCCMKNLGFQLNAEASSNLEKWNNPSLMTMLVLRLLLGISR